MLSELYSSIEYVHLYFWQSHFLLTGFKLLWLCLSVIKTFFHNPRAMRGGLLLLLPSAWSACPDHQGVPKWFRVSIGETMIGQKEGPRLRPWTILGDPTDHPTPSNGELVDSPWQEDTLAIRLKQLLISAIIHTWSTSDLKSARWDESYWCFNTG